MKIISFAIQKGGAGKTTSAVCVSSWLAKRGKKVLLIDMDPQSNATECIIDPSIVGNCIGDLLLDKCSIEKAIYEVPYLPSMNIIPAKPDMLIDEYRGHFSSIFNDTLRLKLESLPKNYNYDYIFCDCPPNLLHFTKNALIASNYVVIPLEPEYLPFRGLSEFIGSILPDLQTRNRALKLGGVILVHRAPGNRKYMPAEIREKIDILVPNQRFKSEIRLDQNLARMSDLNQPICIFAPTSQGGSDYATLSFEFEARLPP